MSRVPICQHIKVDGVRCGSPALRDHRYCYFHANSRSQLARRPESQWPARLPAFPVLEDGNAIQVALMQVISAVLDNGLEREKAALILWALQTAAGNIKHVRFEPDVPFTRLKPVVRDAPVSDPNGSRTAVLDPPHALSGAHYEVRDGRVFPAGREGALPSDADTGIVIAVPREPSPARGRPEANATINPGAQNPMTSGKSGPGSSPADAPDFRGGG